MAKKIRPLRASFRRALVFPIVLPVFLFMGSGLLAALIDDISGAMRRREYDMAIRMSEGGQADASKNPQLLLIRANALRIQEKFGEAIEVYDLILANRYAADEKVKANFGKAYSLMSLKRFGEAEKILRGELERLHGGERMRAHILLYMNMADELSDEGNKEKKPNWFRAIELYTAALEYGDLPADLEYRLRISRARCRLALGNGQALLDQRTELDGILTKTPKVSPQQEAETRYFLGRTYRFVGNMDAAEHHLTIAARIPGGGEFSLPAAGELLDVLFSRNMGRSELVRGRTIVRETIARHPKDPKSGELLFRVAMVELNTGDTANALASLTEYAGTWPEGENAPEALLRAAEAHIALNKHAEAVQSLRDLLSKYPGSRFWQQAQTMIIRLEYDEAERAFDNKKYADAERLWTSFIARYPFDKNASRAALQIGRSMENRQEYKRAVEWWDNAWQRWQDHSGEESCFLAARLLADELDDYERAITFLQRLSSGAWRDQANERMRELREEFLSLSTEKIFTEKMSPALTLRTRNIEKIRVRLYALDAEAYFRAQANLVNIEKLDVDLIAPDKEFFHTVADYKKYRLTNITLPIETESVGTWVVQCSSDTLQASTLLVKSDIALVARAAHGQVLVHTSSLTSGRALPGVDVLISNGGEIAGSGKTSPDGIFVYNSTNEQAQNNISVFAKLGKNIAAVTPGWFSQYRPHESALLTHFSGDKLAYRPGDRARFRVTLRMRDASGALAVPKGEFALNVTSPSGMTVLKTNAAPDEFGTISGEFDIDRAEPRGSCVLSILSPDRKYSGAHVVRVEQYQAKESEVRFSQSPIAPLPGDTIQISVRSSYLFGEPAAGRELLWRVNQEDWQNGMTDASGNILLTIESSQRVSARPITVTVKPSWDNNEYRHEIVFARNDFSLEIKSPRALWLDTEKARVSITLTPIEGAKASRAVTLKTERITDGQWIEISKREITTDNAGAASLELPSLAAGQYHITASALTSSGESILAGLFLTSSGADDQNKIYLLPDTTEAVSGRETKLRVFSRLERAQAALVSYESDRLTRQESILLPPGNSVISFTPGADLAPQFRVAIDAGTADGHHGSVAEFTLRHSLQIEMDTGKAKPEPGAEVKLSIKAKTPDGKGARASFFLFVIDDSIWSALRVDTRNIVSTFFPERGLAHARSQSFTPFMYSASTGKRDQNVAALETKREQILAESPRAAAGGMDALSNLMKRAPGADEAYSIADRAEAEAYGGFDDAENQGKGGDGGEDQAALAEYAWFASALTSDADGNASASFTLPNLPARWRVVAVAAAASPFFGEAEHTLDAVSENYAKISAPDFMNAGDTLRIPVLVAGAARKGTLSWRIEDQQKKSVANGALPYELSAKVSGEVFIPFTAREAGNYILRVTADSFSAAAPLVILPAGERRVSGASSIVRGAWRKRLTHTAGSTDRVLRIRAAAPEQLLFDPAPPFIGRGQLSGRIASLVRDSAALEYLKALKSTSDLDTSRGVQLAARMEETLRHLSVLAETSWRYQVPGNYDMAWLGFALQQSRSVGVPAPANLSKWVSSILQKLFSDSDNTELKAILLFALAGEGDTSFAWMNRLYRDRETLENRELALLALALNQAGRPDMSGVLADQIASRFKREDGQASLPGKGDAIHRWMSQTSATTALGALALISIAPTDTGKRTIVGEALAWLNADSRYGWWRTPVENGLIPLVHAKFLKAEARTASWQARVSVNGRDLGTITGASPRSLELKGADLSANTSDIEVRVEGQGACFVSVEAEETLPAASAPQRDFSGSFDLRLIHPPYTFEGKSIDQGMTIVTTATEAPGNTLRRIARGRHFAVEMEISIDDAIEDTTVVAELSLPAGFRSLPDTGFAQGLAGLRTIPDMSRQGRELYRETAPGIVRFLVQLAPGQKKYIIREVLLANTEGEVTLPGARVYPLALPWKRTGTGAQKLSILPIGGDMYAGYAFSADELYALGKIHYERAEYARARVLLEECITRWVIRNVPAREIGLMLLDIAVKENNAREIVRHFESLRERYQDISIPLKQAEMVAGAYARLGEQERACQVLDGIIEARFLRESSISGALLSAGKITEASAFLRALVREYPDGNQEMTALASLAQQLFPLAYEGSAQNRNISKDWLYAESLSIFDDVLLAAPDSALAPEVAFTAASFLFELERYPEVEARARTAVSTYSNTHFKDSFQYLGAGALYFGQRFAEADKGCNDIVHSLYTQPDGSQGISRYRDYALHMQGKIRHAEQRYSEAMRLYEQVRNRFRDAQHSIEFLRSKQIALPEITSAAPDQEIALRIESRNVHTASLALYRVDFLILCLKQKDLRNVTGVTLSGIRPSLTTNITLGSGNEGMTEISEIAIPLPRNEQGAWLAVVKGDGFEQSSMILRSKLVLDVHTTEDGSVRASLHDRVSKKPISGASVRFIPVNNEAAITLTSDPRGTAESRMLGSSMTIAADYNGEYAFQRIGRAGSVASLRPRPEADYDSGYKEEAMEEVMQYRNVIQQENRQRWEQNQMLNTGGLDLQNLRW